jgi:hypothetical protein
VDFTLPSSTSWQRLVDTQAYYDLPAGDEEADGYFSDSPHADPFTSANISLDNPTAVSGSYSVAAMSIVVLEER